MTEHKPAAGKPAAGSVAASVGKPAAGSPAARKPLIAAHWKMEQTNAEAAALQRKVPAALGAGLLPILCVGETEEEREAGQTERKLRHQIQTNLADVPPERLPEVVIAYEPIWAIGTGKTATGEQAQDAVAFVRAL